MKALFALTGLSVALWITGCTQQATEEASDAVDAAGETASGAMNAAAETASDAAESVSEAAGTTVEAAKVVAEDAAETASEVKENIEEGMAALVEKASAALSSIEGGPEILKNVTGFFDSAKEALSGITDTQTAQAAVAKFGELGGSIDGLSQSMSGLPEEAKSALAGVIEKGSATLKTLIEKANSLPGVKEIIQPKIDELMQKISALTGKE